MSEKVLEKLFGREFLEKYRQARARAEQIPQQRLEQIKQFAIEQIRNTKSFSVKYDNLDILLVFAPYNEELLGVKKTSAGNYKITAVWYGSESLRGPFISVFTGLEEHAKQLVRATGAPSLIVGKLREDSYEGDITYNFRCLGVIPLQEDSDIIDAEKNTEDKDFKEFDEEWSLADITGDKDDS